MVDLGYDEISVDTESRIRRRRKLLERRRSSAKLESELRAFHRRQSYDLPLNDEMMSVSSVHTLELTMEQKDEILDQIEGRTNLKIEPASPRAMPDAMDIYQHPSDEMLHQGSNTDGDLRTLHHSERMARQACEGIMESSLCKTEYY
jgi:hypothetical protein